ncbi:MAG: phosphodiester glycosidase family protein [Armatimonadetes bacterium]|nr:phosphodiester glycosidase family protein [Armatimonadota bacterium]
MKRLIRTTVFVLAGLALCGGLMVTPSHRRPDTSAASSPAEVVAPPVPGQAEAAMVYRPPTFRNSRKQRSDHVARSWELIGGVGINIVTVNLRARNVRFMPGFASYADPQRGYFPRQNFYHIVRHYRPRVAINGTYFHLLNGTPTGPIVRHGTMLYDGRWGTTICLDEEGGVTFRYQSGTYGRHRGWEGVYNAICTGPTLVRDGKPWLHPRKEGFRDPAVLGKARRSALGLTWDNRLVLVTIGTPITLNKLGNIMLRLNCKQAANLDGGSSSALYCNGEYVTKPNRKLSNVLLVYD